MQTKRCEIIGSISLVLFFSLQISVAVGQQSPKGLSRGQEAPSFVATDQSGEKIELKKLLQHGPVVLLFYRGEWCPYCNKQLAQLQDSLFLFAAKQVSVIAVSPELPSSIAKTVEKNKLQIPVLHDKDLRIMNDYDVAFTVDPAVVNKYKSFGIDLAKANGSNSSTLPVPAVYIIGQNGIIQYVYFNENYKQRVSVSELLAHL